MHILHRIPGRIRLSVPELGEKEDASILRSYLESLDGIIKCTVSNRRSSVLLLYDAERIKIEQILTQINIIMLYLERVPVNEKYSLLTSLGAPGCREMQANKTGAARKVIAFSLIYLLYKWKQAKYGKFALSRSIPWLQAASLVTIMGGYPLLKGYYKKYTRELPGNSEDILKQASVFFTVVRESTKGIFVLALKTLNDWVKFSADSNNLTEWQREQEEIRGIYAVAARESLQLRAADGLRKDDLVLLSARQAVPATAVVVEGEALIIEPESLSVCRGGDYVNAGCIVQEGQVIIKLLHAGKPHKEQVIHLDDVHQPETLYQWGITRIALAGAFLSYLVNRSSLSALAVLLVLSPSAGNAAVSSGLNNCVYRFSRHQVLVPDPNRLMGILECRQVVIHQDLISREITEHSGGRLAAAVVEQLNDLGLDVSILTDSNTGEKPYIPSTTFISNEVFSQQPGRCILVSNVINEEYHPDIYTILLPASPTENKADILVFDHDLRDLPDILKEVKYARKVISQSVFFTQAFNIWFGANAIFKPFDAFAAKSLNTTNSLVALLSNKRILQLPQGRVNV